MLNIIFHRNKNTLTHTNKLHFSNLCCITVADIHSILYYICMYIFYIYVRVLILMLKKKRNNEKYEFIRLFRITLVYYYYIFLLITSMYYLSSTLCIYLYLYELPKSSGVLWLMKKESRRKQMLDAFFNFFIRDNT